MFIKYFEEFKETQKNTPLLYTDDNLEVKVVKSFSSSKNQGKDTDWCSNGEFGFYSHDKTSNMYRFNFKDGYKLRLTWDYISKNASSLGPLSGGTHWGQGGKSSDGHKLYYDVLRPEDESEPFYIDWKSGKNREIVNRIQSIPQKAIDAVHNYQEKASRSKSEKLVKMYNEIQKIKILQVDRCVDDMSDRYFKYENNFLVKISYRGKEFEIKCRFDDKFNCGFTLGKFEKIFRNKYAIYGREIRMYLFDKMMEWCKKNNTKIYEE